LFILLRLSLLFKSFSFKTYLIINVKELKKIFHQYIIKRIGYEYTLKFS